MIGKSGIGVMPGIGTIGRVIGYCEAQLQRSIGLMADIPAACGSKSFSSPSPFACFDIDIHYNDEFAYTFIGDQEVRVLGPIHSRIDLPYDCTHVFPHKGYWVLLTDEQCEEFGMIP